MKTKFIFNLFLLFSVFGFAQESTVSGVVIGSDDGMPAAGVNVVIQGTTEGTSTDFDGNYTISVTEGDVLEFTYIGFKKVAIPVNGQSVIDVKLEADLESLDEVVVIGFGTQKRSDLTGSVSSIKSEELLKQPALNATQSIQGKLSGVNIINTNAPGSEPVVMIRGLGTAASGTTPLYIVDGVQVSGISNINPADIENMDVMKDAASAAIYGMDAANGVVFITTKKGKSGKAKISLSSYMGATSMLNQVEMANASDYITYFNEVQTSIGGTNLLSTEQLYDTDWFDELTNVGFSNNNNISISGANDKINYFFSFNNYSEDGILEGQNLARNTIRSNNTFNILDDRIKFTQNISASFIKSIPKPYSSFNEAYRQAPIVPAYYKNGDFGQPDWDTTTGLVAYQGGSSLNSIGNPLATVYYNNEKDETTDLQGSFDLEVKITDDLKVNSRYGATKTYYKSRVFSDIKSQYLTTNTGQDESDFEALKEANPEVTTYADNSLSYTTSESYRFNWDTYLTFDKQINNHSINVVAGLTKGSKNDIYNSYQQAYDVPEKEQYWNINFASDDYDQVSQQYYSTPIHQLSYYSRLQYNYNQKYFLQANIRRDGISTFNNDNDTEYFGNFPSFSAGWVLTKENFLSDVKNLDFLKIRAGWGKLGNSDVPFNVSTYTTSTTSSNTNYVFGANQDLVYGAALGASVYPISWEVTKETNLGLDFQAFDYKLSGNFNYYNRNTENAILYVTPVYTSGESSNFYDHGAEVINKGFEVELNWKDNISEDFSYNVGLVFSNNKNNVENVKDTYDGQTGGSLSNGQVTKKLEEGQPIYAWWMWEADGVWQNQDEIDNNAHYGSPSPGHLRYKDQNDDGVIDDNDKKFLGSYMPTYNFGFNFGVNYKNFDLAVDAFGAGGNKIYNGLKGTRIDGGENIAAATFTNRWTGEGSTNSDPGADRDSYASSYYLEDGDYLRINNITIGYTLPKIVNQISRIRIYATAKNPFMFTGYSGFTPEIVGSSDSTGASGTSGIELSAYPNTKTFILGVNVDL
ncbi:TonB-dependent receptor [Cellulophaga baltica]|uniref:SusC/RagA family TonB-linked outer membrane protein n=1 Tax=Cellulophaga TaxID=104264 RepID=UPI001C07EB6A|nr:MULTISPECIES: TonB-dependent receptor [Cellulophaga]MBU2997837.1 TonB-dependent receptor [Cellulophaga baltica]MDO6769236.1 TonB-dependent receptor [Cellulophaga sp. 1_MG-2023]